MVDNQNGAKQLAQEQENITFEKLTPTTLSPDEMRGYNEALDFIFKEEDLLNIAISGPYASGKSSVFKTYEDEHKELNGIHISLSYFSPNLKSKIENQNPDNEFTFNDELMLERKIINQLIHQIDPKQIPYTDFKVKAESKSWINIFWASIISVFFCCVIYIDKTLLNKWLEDPTQLTLILIGSLFALITFVSYKIIDLQHRKNLIRKLKIFESELDISSECDVSYFDKYLDEIIYILDKSKLHFIVFEDIDRYDDNLILSKLRELNYIYNKRQKNRKRKLTKRKTIKFIYLIKDEIFDSKERTKFFDYILPIVPVMDNSNSLGKMEQLFKSKNIYSDFSISFLDTLSLYLDDIRLIKNICNEYIIYKKKLPNQASWFKKENLLAIIVYKNIFPEDYSLTRLGLGQGVVHRIIESLIKQRNSIYQTQIEQFDSKIQLKKEEIENLEPNHLENLDELEALYIKFPSELDYRDLVFNDGTIVSTLNTKEFISKLKRNNYKIINRRVIKELDCKEYFNDLEQNSEYKNEQKKLKIIFQNKKSKLEEEIRKLEKEKLQFKSPKKITELIKIKQTNNTTIDTLFRAHIYNQTGDTEEKIEHAQYKFEYEKLSASCYFPLLRVLIIQGYIDENYNDYTSFYNEQGLPQNDTLFLRNINEQIENDWQLELKKPEIVLKRLNSDNSSKFYEIAVLNYSLLDHILATNKTSDLSQFINLLASHAKTNFIDQYLARYYTLLIDNNTKYQPKYLGLFVKEINIQLWDICKSINTFDLKLYLYLSFIHNELIELEKMNKKYLKDFIEKPNNCFLCIDEEWNRIFQLLDETKNHLSKITDAFAIMNIQFKQIEHSTPELLALVEANNYYELNYVNVKYILENKYNLTNFDSHIIQTLLTLSDDAPVKVYFQSNPEPLVSFIAKSDISIIDDNEDTVLFILNHGEISLSVKIVYIDKNLLAIKLLEQVTDKSVWNKLLEKQKIEYSAENIVYYFFNYELEDENKERKINDQLAKFINNNHKNISPQQASLKKLISGADNINLFFRQIILNTKLNPDKYSMLISWFNGRYYPNFDFKELSKGNISILIQLKAIVLREKQDLNFIRENYPDNIQEFIIHNFNDYINKLNKDSSLINDEEIISLLSEKISLNKKFSLLALTKEPISINNKNYPTELQNYILKNNFDVKDLNYITNHQFYDSTTDEIKQIIRHLCVEYQEEISEIREISYSLLIKLLKITEFSLDDKYSLLCNQITDLAIDYLYHLFKVIEQDPTNENLFSNLFIGKNQYFDNTTLNQKILKELNQKWKLKYEIKEDKIMGYGQKLIEI
ncbi:coiled-coil domain-containing protein [Gilliamella apicola]|uniref:coiled-coil domain-containing protein n=1 Tax=Gilliamella apicola TaxID=1196095 RepID=UPI002FEE5808